jgi:hypothetical protein
VVSPQPAAGILAQQGQAAEARQRFVILSFLHIFLKAEQFAGNYIGLAWR